MKSAGINNIAVGVRGAMVPDEPIFGKRVLGGSTPYINESFYRSLPAGTYTTERISRKYLGSRKRDHTNNEDTIDE
jgi:hypothetical protein